MSINLIETVQQNMGYPPLQKIDPNTQQVIADEKMPAEDKFSQAAIPAVLTALFSYVQSDNGATTFLNGDHATNWVGRIFDDNKKEIIHSISTYATKPNADTVAGMNAIANEAVKLVKKNLTGKADIKEVKLFFSKQKNNILLYLPAALNMGELLHDNTLDDKTNKMEGPVSSLMQSIGAAFTNPVTSEEIKEQ